MTPYELALKEIGTVEWTDGHNPKVLGYFKDAGHPEVMNDETAWCAAFVGAMLHRAGLKGTGQLTARSYLNWGVKVDRAMAKPGDIVILKRGNSSWQGHVGFFVKDNGDSLTILGGNQNNAVNRRTYKVDGGQLLGLRRMPTLTPVTSEPVIGLHGAAAQKTSWLTSLLNAIFGRKA